MSIVWHLIRKDHRVLGKWLALWAGIQVLATVLCYVAWTSGLTPNLVTAFLWPVMIFGTCVVALVVHQEPLVRGVGFWRTRPLRPKHLLLGKGFTIGLHFVLIPSLICLAFLLAAGYRDYLGLAGVEWLWKLMSWLTPVVAIAVFSDSMSRFFGIALGLIVGGGVVLAIHGAIRSEVIAYDAPLWLQFPSKSLVVTAVLMVFGFGLTLRQYLIGGRRGAIKWLVVAALVIQGVWWLPLSRYQSSPKGSLPPSSAVLDELVEDIGLTVGPLSPRGLANQPHSERDGAKFLWVKREPSFVVGPGAHGLHLSIDEGASRLETARGTIVSANPQPISMGMTEGADYLAAIGAGSTVPPFRGGSVRLMEVPRPVVDQLGDETGTLYAEAVAMLRESEVIARLPLRVGAMSQKGPHTIKVQSVKRQIDRNNGDPEIHIVYSVYYPSRVMTEPWFGVTSDGHERAWLVHRRLNIALNQGGGGRSSGRLHPLMNHHRFDYGFSAPTQVETLDAVLSDDEFHPDDWDLVFVRKRMTASKRLPFTVADFQLTRQEPETSEELLAKLDTISLAENASDEEAEDYFWQIWECWTAINRATGEAVQAKLMALGPEHLPAILRVHERLIDNYWAGGAKFDSLRAVKKLVAEEHRELVLAHLDRIPDLLGVVQAQGWEDSALPRMIEIAQGLETVPRSWVEFFIQMRVRHPEVILGLRNDRGFDEKYFEGLRQIPEFPLEAFVDRILLMAMHDYHFRPPEGLLSALTLGRPNALDYARLYLKGARRNKKLDHAGPLLERLAALSECPSTVEGASAWLEQHARTATLDETTGHYQIAP